MRLTQRQPRETGRDYALRTIKDNIIHMELAPGSMVSENELAAAMGLSRTPVREALIELSKVKIVEIYPQKGSAVALIDYDLVESLASCVRCWSVRWWSWTVKWLRRRISDVCRKTCGCKIFYLENYYPETLMDLDNQFHALIFEIAHKDTGLCPDG